MTVTDPRGAQPEPPTPQESLSSQAQPPEKLTRILRRKSRSALVLVVAVALLGPALLLTQYYFSQRTSTVYTPIVDTTSQLMITMRWAQSDLRMDRAYGLPGAADRLAAREREATEAIDELTQLASEDSAFIPLLSKVTRSADSWWGYANTVVGASPDPDAAPMTRQENILAVADFTAFNAATESMHRLATEKRVDMRTWRTSILVGGSVLAITVVLLVSFAIIRDTRRTGELISDPIEELDRVARADAEGDRGTRARIDRGPAEIRALATAFNDLLDTRDQYEESRDDYVQRLEELDRQKDDFLSTVSHELRTPLASIIGYTEMLCDGDGGDLSKSQLHLVSVVQRNADRLRGLIEDLLILSRIEAKNLEGDHVPLRLDHTVADVLESLGPVARRAGLTVHEHLDPVELEGDALQLERAVTNLVSNAIKFTPSGGSVTVALTADTGAGDRTYGGTTSRGGAAILSVSDTGIGIPADEQKHLGTRFFRASTAQRASIPGSGLGLSIVRAIAGSHGGGMDFESVAGEGTTFRITLPLPTGSGSREPERGAPAPTA